MGCSSRLASVGAGAKSPSSRSPSSRLNSVSTVTVVAGPACQVITGEMKRVRQKTSSR